MMFFSLSFGFFYQFKSFPPRVPHIYIYEHLIYECQWRNYIVVRKVDPVDATSCFPNVHTTVGRRVRAWPSKCKTRSRLPIVRHMLSVCVSLYRLRIMIQVYLCARPYANQNQHAPVLYYFRPFKKKKTYTRTPTYTPSRMCYSVRPHKLWCANQLMSFDMFVRVVSVVCVYYFYTDRRIAYKSMRQYKTFAHT